MDDVNEATVSMLSLNELLAMKSAMSADELICISEMLKKCSEELRATEKDRRIKQEAQRQKQIERSKREREARDAHVSEVTSMDLPLDWQNAFDTDERTRGVHAESISDGLILSLTNLGRVDIEYISCVTGEDYKTVICALNGSIYQNPDKWDECFYKGWETADEYLSGNLMRKWKAANKANEAYQGYFAENISAIEKVLPKNVPTKDIYITLGSPWVPSDIIDDFMLYLFGEAPKYIADRYQIISISKSDASAVRHDELTGTWFIPDKNRYSHNVATTKTYGTDRLEALRILEKTLNMQAVEVYDEIEDKNCTSGKKRVFNNAETVEALEKQRKLIDEFQKWVWTDESRKERLEIIFENKFSCVRKRIFDGSFLQFPGMSPDVELYPHQKNAVARILFSPNTLLAHDVGAGKTYVMVAAGMELRRMGLSKKNLFVVPNNIIGQWKEIFLAIYPNADLLCIEPKNFTPDKRKRMLERIRDEDHDGIIMPYSCFEQISLSKECYLDELYAEKELLEKRLSKAKNSTPKTERLWNAVSNSINKLICATIEEDDEIYFDRLGITRLFVDEAHNFKNVPIDTNLENVLGINKKGSKKCKDMMDKVHTVQKQNSGSGVVMATGTPITNSVTDAYVMQKYLQSGELAMLDLQSFDSWIGMFAEKSEEFEIDVDTSRFRLTTRFARFHNLPELTALLSSVADFHSADKWDGVPETDGYNDAVIGKTNDFQRYLDDISMRAELVRLHLVSRKNDNMLKITTDGRKAALDMRLVVPYSQYTDESKVAQCANNVYELYLSTYLQKGTQIVFCDSSTPKSAFNIYDEMKKQLIARGVEEEKIAFIHDADSNKERSELFAKMRSGEIRVLIGSTFKLGLGVNIQDRLIALHHLDVPWRPADMTQREGRILRCGNTNEKVYIFRYITEGSFDAYSWQLLETKQKFISALLSGSLDRRSSGDVNSTVLSYAEVKALAIGNPLIKKRVETANKLSKYSSLQRSLVESRQRMEIELAGLPTKVQKLQSDINACEEDIEFLANEKPTADKAERRHLREILHTSLIENMLQKDERLLVNYRGFDIILPVNMAEKKPFVWLQRKGRYYVELGGTEIGDLTRIDNFLDSLGVLCEKLGESISRFEVRKAELKSELKKGENYTELIEEIKAQLETIDIELGVIK